MLKSTLEALKNSAAQARKEKARQGLPQKREFCIDSPITPTPFDQDTSDDDEDEVLELLGELEALPNLPTSSSAAPKPSSNIPPTIDGGSNKNGVPSKNGFNALKPNPKIENDFCKRAAINAAPSPTPINSTPNKSYPIAIESVNDSIDTPKDKIKSVGEEDKLSYLPLPLTQESFDIGQLKSNIHQIFKSASMGKNSQPPPTLPTQKLDTNQSPLLLNNHKLSSCLLMITSIRPVTSLNHSVNFIDANGQRIEGTIKANCFPSYKLHWGCILLLKDCTVLRLPNERVCDDAMIFDSWHILICPSNIERVFANVHHL